MKKQIVLTFLLGAAFGGGISAFYFSGSTSTEVKVLTRTEYKEVQVPQPGTIDVPKYPEHDEEDSIHDADDVGEYESHDEPERSMASDQEPSQEELPEDMPSMAPEEESPGEEPSEN